MNSNYVSIDFLNEIPLFDYKFSMVNYEFEQWNKEYEAFNFEFNGMGFKSRLAKKTPKKAGYFVAFWCKNESGKNRPFNFNESKDKLIINIVDGPKKGQFIFPKELLVEKGIIRSEKHKGKMAIRVYPSWETGLNKTAISTQRWQIPYFLDFTKSFDEKKIKKLYLS
ncbi:MepB family protein [Staphylococcus hyicus]|uniref:MepB family protein n=1 Tax=Staphylococcus TaxID=1279 RepID=UPI00118B4C4A|nr:MULTISPECIES: MepB family protein [Staphylococcus]QDW99632.1 MepB protein [Staphylococcus agnetis]UWF56701.1 MepB family protein [Staphylococcus hyicus]